MKKKHLVVDTAGFVKNLPLWEYGEELYSVPEVLSEIRDKSTHRWFESLPVAIKMREPQPWAIKFINDFSKKTGDFGVLSLADVKVMALTYELEIEARGSSDHLRKEPQKPVIEGPSPKSETEKQPTLAGFHLPTDKEEGVSKPDFIGQNPLLPDDSLQVDLNALVLTEDQTDQNGMGNLNNSLEDEDYSHEEVSDGEDNQSENGNELCEESEDSRDGIVCECQPEDEENSFDEEDNQNEDEDDDDDEGWITPSNIKKVKLKEKVPFAKVEEEEKDILVACLTADFAMQNVLKHIGLSIMGVDGKIIWQIKTYILRCYACFKLCSDVSKVFCPRCGNKTLKRVSVTVNPDGTQKIWINFKRPINKRGMIFSLPKPKGGQHARNPILVADQKEVRQFSTKKSMSKINPLHEDYGVDNSPFAVRDVYSRAAQYGYMGGKCHNHYYWEQRNPNLRSRKHKKKK